MYCAQRQALYRNGLSAQAPQKSYPCSTCKNSAIANDSNRQEIGENPRYIKVERDCTHVGRVKNRAKPHGEAVLIFWLGELQFK